MDFLFENPFLIVIILGILSSMFKKPKNDKNMEESETKPYDETSPIPMPEIFKQFGFEEQADRKKPVSQDVSSEELLKSDYQEKAKAKIAELKERDRNRKQVESRPVQAEELKINRPSNLSEEKRTVSIGQERLKEAIVWAEILGPPRSKKPHRYRNVR